MKYPILTFFASIVFSLTAYGVSNNPNAVIKSKYSEVKVFAQPSSSSLVLLTLEMDQEVNFIRESSANGGGWSIVYHDGRPGYVLSSEIYKCISAQTSKKSNEKKNRSFLSDKKIK